MKASKFFLSTFIAAAAMTSTAWAEGTTTSTIVESEDLFQLVEGTTSYVKSADNIVVGECGAVSGLGESDASSSSGATLTVGSDATADFLTYLWVGKKHGTAEGADEKSDSFKLIVDGGKIAGGSNSNLKVVNTGYMEIKNGGYVYAATTMLRNDVLVTGTSTDEFTASTLKATVMSVYGEEGITATLTVKDGALLDVDNNGLNNNGLNIGHGSTETRKGSVVIDGATLRASKVTVNNSTGSFSVSGSSTINIGTLSGGVMEVTGGMLTDSSVGGSVAVVGSTALAGTSSFGNTKVTNGAKLTVNDKASFAYLAVGNDSGYFDGLGNGADTTSTIDINGTITATQINSDGYGVVNVNSGANVTTQIICVENGGIEGATAGAFNVAGTVNTQRFNVFGGATATISNGGVVNSEQAFTSAAMENVVSVSGNSTLNIDGGTLAAGTLEHTEGRHSGMNIEAGSTVNVHNGKITVGGICSNAGTFNVSGTSTLNIGTLTGTEINLLDGAVIKDSKVGGDVSLSGSVTFLGDNVFNAIYDFGSYYSSESPEKWTVAAGASVTLTHEIGNTNAHGLGYGDDITINGELTDALTARATLTREDASLYAKKGIRLSTSEGNDAENGSFLTVNNAYVIVGDGSSFSNSKTHGKFTLDFNNSVLDSSQLYFSDSNDVINLTLDDTDVLTAIFMTGDKDSTYTLTNSKVVTTGSGNDRYNGNDGTLSLDNSSISVQTGTYKNSGDLTLGNNSTLTVAESFLGRAGTVSIDGGSTLSASALTNDGTITISDGGKLSVTDLTNTGTLTVDGGTLEILGTAKLAGQDVEVGGEIVLAGTIYAKTLTMDTLTIADANVVISVGVEASAHMTLAVSDEGSGLSFDTLKFVVDDEELDGGTLNLDTLIEDEATRNLVAGEISEGEEFLVSNKAGDVVYTATLSGSIVALGSQVPEPSAFGLLAGIGALALVAARRRRR